MRRLKPARKRPTVRTIQVRPIKKRIVEHDLLMDSANILLEASSALEACDGLLHLSQSKGTLDNGLGLHSGPDACQSEQLPSTAETEKFNKVVASGKTYVSCKNW